MSYRPKLFKLLCLCITSANARLGGTRRTEVSSICAESCNAALRTYETYLPCSEINFSEPSTDPDVVCYDLCDSTCEFSCFEPLSCQDVQRMAAQGNADFEGEDEDVQGDLEDLELNREAEQLTEEIDFASAEQEYFESDPNPVFEVNITTQVPTSFETEDATADPLAPEIEEDDEYFESDPNPVFEVNITTQVPTSFETEDATADPLAPEIEEDDEVDPADEIIHDLDLDVDFDIDEDDEEYEDDEDDEDEEYEANKDDEPDEDIGTVAPTSVESNEQTNYYFEDQYDDDDVPAEEIDTTIAVIHDLNYDEDIDIDEDEEE